jgi:hypothetical protein
MAKEQKERNLRSYIEKGLEERLGLKDDVGTEVCPRGSRLFLSQAANVQRDAVV